MSGKKKKKSLKNTYIKKLKSYLKTELITAYLTSDDKKFIDEYEAVIHEDSLEDERKKERRWKEMITNLTELVCKVLEEKKWGIFFKNEPMQALPVQDSATLYKVNEVKREELVSCLEHAINERIDQWPEAQEKQTDNEL
jgi:hypothetical protein